MASDGSADLNPPQASRARILAVDDRRENLVALEAAFQDCDFELVSALSGAEAVNLAASSDFAAVLLDVQMPGMDGYATAREIRSKERSKNTPIIFVTAIDRKDANELKGYVTGAVDFLYKPLDTEVLRAKVNVFVELFRARIEMQRQAELLRERSLEEQEVRLLQRGIAVRDEFLSIASHELNTPITPLSLQMQAFLKLIQEKKFQESDPERLKRMLETAYGQVERLSRIISELVDVSRINAGKLPLVKKQVNLAEVARSVCEEFAEEIRQLGCEVRLIIKDEPVGIWDEMRVEQVLVNLLSNALKYGLGKPIEVQVECAERGKARISFRDQGIGIAPADQRRIFERFERAVSPENYGGLGLGLYITNEIVRLHRGAIALESGLDRGSTFIVDLPLE